MKLFDLMRHLKRLGVVTSKTDEVTGVTEGLSVSGQFLPIPLGMQTLSVGVMGDSISAMSFDISTGYGAVAGDATLSSYGWITWWQFFSGASLEFKKYALSGTTTGYALNTELPLALAGNHDIYTLAPNGINDTCTGDESVANITQIVTTLVNAGKRVLLGTPTPNLSYATSKGRLSVIMAGMRDLAVKYPAQVRLADFARVMADPSNADGGGYINYFDALTYDVDTYATHPNWAGAASLGNIAHKATEDWTKPYIYSVTRGDSANMLPNGQFGGVTGAITSAGANSVAPDNWTGSRGAATVTYSMFKAKRLPLMWKTGTTYPVGSRIQPPTPNGFQYLVLTSAPTGATPPGASNATSLAVNKGAWSSLTGALAIPASVTHVGYVWVLTQTVADVTLATPGVSNLWVNAYPDMFSQIQPNSTGPIYLAVPANNSSGLPEIGEDLLLLGSSTTMSANDYAGVSNVSIDATDMVGQRVKAGLWLESLGSIAPLVQLRVDQYDSSNARISGAFGMMANSVPGSPKAPYATLGCGVKGLIATPSFLVAPNCAQLRIFIRSYLPSNGYQTAILVSDGFISSIA